MESISGDVREVAAQKHKNNLQKQNKQKHELEAKKINVNEVGIT